MENADVFLGLQDFLERMRQPSAADFVKSIKSFIVSFSNNTPDPERDSALVQEFLANMEAAFRAHPLWAGCSDDDLESAGEGLEKYVMTKLFTRVFASLPDDVKADEQLSEKMSLIQQFIRPENLDVKPTFQNETSWLLAQKELQKINMYKAPRDKLVCILNCCRVINNLLLNASIASNENPPGADDFLPVLIYVTLKANPPQLHSNLLYIQRYRRQSRLVSEAAYFFTNMLSAESFITNIDAKSISMDETEFEKNMEFARALISGLSTDWENLSNQSDQITGNSSKAEVLESKPQIMESRKEWESSVRPKTSDLRSGSKDGQYVKDESTMGKAFSLSDLENKGAVMLLKEDLASLVFREYPYLFAHAGDLTINDVEDLLSNYKQLVFKYVCLSKGLGGTTSHELSNSQTNILHDAVTIMEHLDSRQADSNDESQKESTIANSSSTFSLVSEENFESKSSQDEALAQQEGKETSQ
ncbi:vacuolar protein sorting-associated protein 9A-like isoform X1 [Mercurialis annua]|uniref:vacuolar protein sorting-associated protein 9A-like isoform X1 n=1 Tax=Mercurialis annua TaxID=3986 RepID=UPI002160A20C|nr:vacuolar protein sorting-associated protein 9A-like isoform X1 [Mercurialis annua]